ncbi:ATP-dependent transcriptional regulator, MalT-like, LuxR family [Candidatus Accumulibacter aalborgensis]|uniref:ATP-dependent transcriptional regulator, MalT-like, LuxR family n=1 Tax=Candidatus Accumulibacter aalborgensis TaxID=1860102 RepID=A0A1A8XIN4_9PROT|nr:ATP-dependent transcriptional regulator, MalT-like, LuxR family [Candidatus Accumulibacter aalborgensis]
MPLVHITCSKLHCPRIVHDFVVRSELLARLEAGSELPLTLLSAPAGYGKTSLVADWLGRRDGSSVWLSLDSEDSDPLVLLGYLVAAVRSAFVDACGETLDHLNSGQRLPLPVLASSLSNDLDALSAPLVVVLDDFHRLHSSGAHALLDRLLARPSSALHLVIITRQEPRLSLGALRVHGMMSDIRTRDLQFSALESATLIERCAGRAVPGAALASLQNATDGWPVAVRLAGLALRQGRAVDASGECDENDYGRCISGQMPPLQPYFVEEVLSQQPAVVRDCLLRTSVVDRFCAPLCDALLGKGTAAGGEEFGGQAFMHLVVSGAVLASAVDDRLEWHRYHRLFGEFLQRELRMHHAAAEIAELHQRAAAWLETQGLLEEAIPQMLAGAGVAAATELLARHHNLLINREQRQRLDRCLRLLPLDAVEDDPQLLLLKAWLMHHQGRHRETPAVLDRIEALLDSHDPAPDTLRSDWLHGNVLALRSLQHYLEGCADLALACAEQALQRLATDCVQARVTAQAVLAGARQLSGDLGGARQSIHDALVRASGPIDICQASLVVALCFIDWMAADLSALQWTANLKHPLSDASFGSQINSALGRYFLGLVQYQRNELAPAEATLLPAIAAQQAPQLGYRTEISFALAAVYQALGQAERAREIVDAVCERLVQNKNSPALFRARACQADLALRQGRINDALDWARSFDPGPVQFDYRFFSAPHLTLIRVWMAEGTVDSREQAGRLLQLLAARLSARHNLRFLIEVLALQALLHHAQGEEAAATDLLGRALAVAQPGGFIRLFVDLGQELAPLLKRLEADKGQARYVAQILSAFKDDWLVSAGRQRVGTDLTRRELKILKLLAARLSNVEISEELCISRATVKRHTQNIYRKLRASSRHDAVFRARTLNLLADG